MKIIHIPVDDHIHWKFTELMKKWKCSNQPDTFAKMVDECYIPIEESKRDD